MSESRKEKGGRKWFEWLLDRVEDRHFMRMDDLRES